MCTVGLHDSFVDYTPSFAVVTPAIQFYVFDCFSDGLSNGSQEGLINKRLMGSLSPISSHWLYET